MMVQVLLLVLSTLLVISSNSFWSLWVSLELYSFFLMPWLIEGESKTSKVNIFFYFLTQFLASMGLLVGSMTFFNKICSIILFSSLMMKLSCFPFHSWFVAIVPNISWDKILILSSLSKLLPLSMIVFFVPPKGFFWVMMLGLVVPLGGYGTACLRSIMAYSSVAHSSWLVICSCLSSILSSMYIMMYFIMSLPLIFLFNTETLTSMKSALASSKEQLTYLMVILSLSGVPPFLGFIPKILVVQLLVDSGIMVEAALLGLLSILPVYFYFKTGILTIGTKLLVEFSFHNSMAGLALSVGVSVVVLMCLLLSSSLSVKH